MNALPCQTFKSCGQDEARALLREKPHIRRFSLVGCRCSRSACCSTYIRVKPSLDAFTLLFYLREMFRQLVEVRFAFSGRSIIYGKMEQNERKSADSSRQA
jgi:hypothetical protein